MKHLTWDDRLKIEALYKAGTPVQQIADIIGCCRKTIYNELNRGQYMRLEGTFLSFVRGYSPEIAQQKYDFSRCGSRPLKIGDRHDICDLLAQWLLSGMSPAVCARRLSAGAYGLSLSAGTIYHYVKAGYIPGVTMLQLPDGLIRRKKKTKIIRRRRAAAGTSIEKRPASIQTREEFGHWEIDCIIGKAQGERQALLTLIERKTRYAIVCRLQRKDARSVVSALDKLEKQFSPNFETIFKSITADNGCEFADAYGMEHSKNGDRRTKVYYCHPYHSAERGSNERNNRLLRRYFPKGKSMFAVKQSDCDAAAAALNDMPRRVLHWHTAAELFNDELQAITGQNFLDKCVI